jgi:hypothetical protein
MAEYVLGQLAHGVADGTIRGDRLVLPVPEGRYRGDICELTGRVVSSPDR